MRFYYIYMVQGLSLLISLLNLSQITKSDNLEIYLNVLYLGAIFAPMIDIEINNSFISQWKSADSRKKQLLTQSSYLVRIGAFTTLLVFGLGLRTAGLSTIEYEIYALSLTLTFAFILTPSWILLAEEKIMVYAVYELFPRVAGTLFLLATNNKDIIIFFIIQIISCIITATFLYITIGSRITGNMLKSKDFFLIGKIAIKQSPLMISRIFSAITQYITLKIISENSDSSILILFRIVNLLSAAAPPATKILLSKSRLFDQNRSMIDIILPALLIGMIGMSFLFLQSSGSVYYPGLENLMITIETTAMIMTPMIIVLSATFGAGQSLMVGQYWHVFNSSLAGLLTAVLYTDALKIFDKLPGGEVILVVELSVLFLYAIQRVKN